MEKKRPNIILLVNDHQAYYGHRGIRRPAFDALAAEGVCFQRAYCASPLCCPSRKTMLTGLLPHNHGQLANGRHTPVDSRETYMDVLAKEGYRQCYVGKWHASAGGPMDLGCEGFSCDDYGNPYRSPEYREYLKNRNLPPARMRVEKNLWKHSLLPGVEEGTLYDFPGSMINEALSGILEAPKESHEAFFLADMACEKLEELAGGETPFMLRVDFWGPHQPYHPTREYASLYPPGSLELPPSFADPLDDKPASYRFVTSFGLQRDNELIVPSAMSRQDWQLLLSRCYGHITLVDEAGGRILAKARELGLMENTLALWTADHGDALACHGGHFDKGAYMPEEVMRIPLAMAWPGHLPQGIKCDALVSNIDFAPTLASAAGGRFSDRVDGRSLLELFGANPGWRRSLMAETHGHINPWLARMVVDSRYKYIRNRDDLEELYDLEDDPNELVNLAAIQGDSWLLQAMRGKLANWRKESNDHAFPQE